MLREEPCQKLSEMITKHGRKVCEEKQRCKGLLLDYCHGYDKEINILLLVLETDIPAELLNTSSETSTELLLKRLIRKVRDKWSLDTEAARWGVTAWARALGIRVPVFKDDVTPIPPAPRNTITLPPPYEPPISVPPPSKSITLPPPPPSYAPPPQRSSMRNPKSITLPPPPPYYAPPPQRPSMRNPSPAYQAPSRRGSNCLVRFLVISTFLAIVAFGGYALLKPYVSLPNSSPSISTPTIDDTTPQGQAKKIIQTFFDDINNKNYEAAYNLWYHNGGESYQQFRNGYSETLHDDVTIVDATVMSDGKIQVNVTLSAKDMNMSRNFKGYYIVGMVNGEWKIIHGHMDKA